MMDRVDFNKLLSERCGIDSAGFETVQVIGASSAEEAAHHLSQSRVNFDPNPIVIRKQDNRAPVEYKQKVFVRYLQPPTVKPGPLIIKEQRAPPEKPMPPLIVRQRARRAKTPPPLILREAPPDAVAGGAPRFTTANGQAFTNEDYGNMSSESNMHTHAMGGGYHSSMNPQFDPNVAVMGGGGSSNRGGHDSKVVQQLISSGHLDIPGGKGWTTEVVRK
ncbi:hypothetical protein ACOME3_010037 [Neoechinorhynchus agilis]